MKSGGFHVKSKDPLARNCNPMFFTVTLAVIMRNQNHKFSNQSDQSNYNQSLSDGLALNGVANSTVSLLKVTS